MPALADSLTREELFHPGHPLCPGCSGGVILRWLTKLLGSDSICNVGATCLALPTLVFPHSLEIPCLYIAMAPSAAGITGTSAALRILRRKGRIPANRKITVFAVTGDGSAGDIGMAALSGAAERNDDGLYFVFDNEAYMNTGIQRSGSSPQFVWTTSTLGGKREKKKDLPRIMAAHEIPYVATLSLAFPEDFVAKVQKAQNMEPGFKYLHIHSPCPTGWRFPEDQTIKIARMAVETGMWMLYEVDHGRLRVTHRPSRLTPVKAYLQDQGRFSALSEQETEALQSRVEQQWRELEDN